MQTTIKKIREELAGIYTTGEIENIIKIIFENVLHYSPVDIILHKDTVLSDFIATKIDKVLHRLRAGEPIQYVMREAYFCGNLLRVTPATLIPRPETEELVDLIAKENRTSDLRVLDIGTGSGAIAVSLARALKFAEVTATDVSGEALDVARENATRLRVKVNFVKQDILTAPLPHAPRYDIVASNPPYITEKERAGMQRNVLDYEPATALFVPDDKPLLFYSAIARYAMAALRERGRLYLEINCNYGNEMKRMLGDTGYRDVEIIKDMYGLDRFATATKPEES